MRLVVIADFEPETKFKNATEEVVTRSDSGNEIDVNIGIVFLNIKFLFYAQCGP